MQVWNVLYVARWKWSRKNWPSACHRTTLSAYTFPAKVCIDNQKKIVKQQYLLHTSLQDGELRPTNGWDRFGSWSTPANFNGFRVKGATCIRRAAITLGIGPHCSFQYFPIWKFPMFEVVGPEFYSIRFTYAILSRSEGRVKDLGRRFVRRSPVGSKNKTPVRILGTKSTRSGRSSASYTTLKETKT